MRQRNILAAPLALFLIGCAAPQATGPKLPPIPDAATDTCAARPYADLVGQDATALERVLIMRQIRLIRPGQPVTADYSESRINFDIGPDNRIQSIHCG